MRVEDATLVRVEHRLLEDRAEASHHDEVDVVRLEHIDHLVRVRETVEVLTEARSLDEHGGHAVRARDVGGAAGRSTTTTATGILSVRMDSRIVPFPDANTADPHSGTLSRSGAPFVRYGTCSFLRRTPQEEEELG